MKLRRKLFASALAVAACAATLTTSTFAWYTTNTEVKASNITGATASTGAASVFISGNNTNWYSALDASSTGNDKIIITTPDKGLLPTAWDGTSKWVGPTGVEDTTATTISFTLYFKTAPTTADVKLGIQSITIKNTKFSEAPTSGDGVLNDLVTGGEYTCNALEALAMRITGTDATEGLNPYGYILTPGQGCVTAATGYTHWTGSKVTGYNAHAYANAVATGSVTNTTDNTIALAAGTQVTTLAANGAVSALTFYIYLNGTDIDCYDACKGQNFIINISFQVTE